jgi:glutathione S-transferase
MASPKPILPMTLIYHPRSPFSRQVYITALELGIASHIKLQQVVVAPVPFPGWSDDNTTVAAFNPLAKIPTLVLKDEGGKERGIFDSRVICDFLNEELCGGRLLQSQSRTGDEKSGRGRDVDGWTMKSLQALADGMADAEVLVVYEERIRGPKGLKFETWIEGQREKIMRGVDMLDREVEGGVLRGPPRPKKGEVSAAEIAIACTLATLEARKVAWRDGREHLVGWFEEWEKRESFVRTGEGVDWSSGEAKM